MVRWSNQAHFKIQIYAKFRANRFKQTNIPMSNRLLIPLKNINTFFWDRSGLLPFHTHSMTKANYSRQGHKSNTHASIQRFAKGISIRSMETLTLTMLIATYNGTY